MKKISFIILAISVFTLMSFMSGNNVSPESNENWYICTNCCKTKKATSAPWESGCISGQHNYQFSGKAGDFNYTCRSCSAEVYLTSSQSPSGTKCCKSGTHTWYHK
jgi:hypothetical protein